MLPGKNLMICACKDFSVKGQLFEEEITVKEISRKKALDAGIRKFNNYEYLFDSTDPTGLIVLRCDLQ